MTKEQSTAEMRYRLGKYVLQVLLDAELITTEEAIKTNAALLEKYDPFTRCLEEVDSWYRCIDGERCIYRDFGNKFNVEISGTNTTSKRKKAFIFLWYEDIKVCVMLPLLPGNDKSLICPKNPAHIWWLYYLNDSL